MELRDTNRIQSTGSLFEDRLTDLGVPSSRMGVSDTSNDYSTTAAVTQGMQNQLGTQGADVNAAGGTQANTYNNPGINRGATMQTANISAPGKATQSGIPGTDLIGNVLKGAGGAEAALGAEGGAEAALGAEAAGGLGLVAAPFLATAGIAAAEGFAGADAAAHGNKQAQDKQSAAEISNPTQFGNDQGTKTTYKPNNQKAIDQSVQHNMTGVAMQHGI